MMMAQVTSSFDVWLGYKGRVHHLLLYFFLFKRLCKGGSTTLSGVPHNV